MRSAWMELVSSRTGSGGPLNEYEYRTGAEASDANSIFKSHEEEKAWSDKFWEYRRQQGAGKRNDRGGGVDKVTI